jgi:hypothetical protein
MICGSQVAGKCGGLCNAYKEQYAQWNCVLMNLQKLRTRRPTERMCHVAFHLITNWKRRLDNARLDILPLHHIRLATNTKTAIESSASSLEEGQESVTVVFLTSALTPRGSRSSRPINPSNSLTRYDTAPRERGHTRTSRIVQSF